MKLRARRMKLHRHVEDMRKQSKIMVMKMKNRNREGKKKPMTNQKKKPR